MEGRAANRRADGGLRNQALCSLPLYRGDGGSVFHCGFRSTDASLGLQVVPVRLISLGGVNFALREPARALAHPFDSATAFRSLPFPPALKARPAAHRPFQRRRFLRARCRPTRTATTPARAPAPAAAPGGELASVVVAACQPRLAGLVEPQTPLAASGGI